MVFLLRKKATATAKAAKENEALKQQVLQLQMQQQQFHQQQQQLQHPSSHQHNQATPKVVNGEALSAMSIQYDSDRISQNPTYAPSNSISTTSSSSTTKPGSATGPAADAAPSTISANGQSSEPIDQLLARGGSDTNASTSTAKNASLPSFRRTSSAHASITAHSQKLPPLHSTVASTSSSYYPSSSGNNGNSPALPANASSSSHTHYNTHKSPSSYGYYRSETDKHARSGSVSSESSYAASETSDVLHNSVGGRSSSGGTTATTPGSTMDKDQSYSSQRKNSLAMTPSQQQQPQQHQHNQHQQAQSQRPVSIERIPVPGAASPSTPSSARQAGTKSALSGVTPADATSVQASPALSSSSSFARKTASRYTLTDFSFQRTLGTGSFGRVHLVRSCHNMRFYAVKVLNKERVVRMKQVEHTNSEREMLERVRHPFLVNLWGTFKDSHNLYMVMDFVSGGELFSLLRKSQRFPDAVAKFFAAEVALALDYLHSLDIIYRDLKPENILLAADGHVKITDFGFAKYVPDITWTLCGTPDYLAPEIVQSKGYNKSVDWYALGVLIFEMLAGYPPFFTEDSNPMRLYEKIIAGKVRYPSYFTEEAKDLLRNLLTGDLSKRFGNLANGSRDIFGHSYFTEVDWNRLYKKEIPAPYVPRVESDGDSSNFDVYAEIDVSEYGQMGADPHGHLFTCF